MAKEPKDNRTHAERRFAELQERAKTVKDQIDAERQAVRAKTARLKAQRLDKQAAEAEPEPKKPARARKKSSP